MNFVPIFYAVLLQNCIPGVLTAENLEELNASPKWVDSLIKHIKKGISFNIQQVTFLTDVKKNEMMETSPKIDELFTKIVDNFPIQRINIADPKEAQQWVLHHEDKDDAFFDSSTTFYIFVHYSSQQFDTPLSRKIIDIMLEMSASQMGTQFLLVLVSQELNDSLDKFLQHVFTRQLLDFTIIEFTESQTSGETILADYEAGNPIIHEFNPFSMEYTRKNWTSDTEWFPDKVLNMWGYPLKIGTTHRPPFSISTYDKFMDPVISEGANIDFLKIIAKKLNFSCKYLPDISKTPEMNKADNQVGIFELMQSGKVDLIAYLSPHYSETLKNTSLRTTAIRLSSLCTVIPILPRVAMPLSLEFFGAYFVCSGIVIVFWITSYILRFKNRSWYPFHIGRALLGVSSVENPTRIPERALYTCLLLVAAIFSSNIYTAITGISLQTNAEMEIASFRELDESGLVPEISVYVYNKTFAHSDGYLTKLKHKTLARHGGIYPSCPNAAIKNKNVSCLLLSDEGAMAVQATKRHGSPRVKFTEPCFWTDSTAFLLGKRSPYRFRINEIIMALIDAGVMKKCYDDALRNIHSVQSSGDEGGNDAGLDQKQNMQALKRQLFALAIIGYALSVVAFLGEIAVDWILRFRSKRMNCV